MSGNKENTHRESVDRIFGKQLGEEGSVVLAVIYYNGREPTSMGDRIASDSDVCSSRRPRRSIWVGCGAHVWGPCGVPSRLNRSGCLNASVRHGFWLIAA